MQENNIKKMSFNYKNSSTFRCQNMHTAHMIKLLFYLIGISANILLFKHFMLFTLVVIKKKKKLLTFLSHIKNTITQIACNHLVATVRLCSKTDDGQIYLNIVKVSWSLWNITDTKRGFVEVRAFYRGMSLHTPNHSHRTRGGAEVFTSTTIYKKHGTTEE